MSEIETPGKIIGEPIAVYHARDAISHSKLEVFRKRPELFRRTYITKTVQRETTKAHTIGQALHSAVLEPEKFTSQFAISTYADFRTKAAQAWREEQEANGFTTLTADDAALVEAMRSAVLAHPLAAKLIESSEPEVTWRQKFPGLPVPLQCRTDLIGSDENGTLFVADLKTTETLEPDSFRNFDRAFINFGYHRQAAWYMTLLADCGVYVNDFYFIAVEKCEPHGVVIYKPTPAAIELGVRENQRDLLALAECYASGKWPNLTTNIQTIDVPEWYAKKDTSA